MKDFLIFLPLTILFLICKSTLAPTLPLPDLPLIIVFYLAYTRASIDGVLLCFILGYTSDVFSGALLGTTSFSFLLIYALVHLVSKWVHFLKASIRGLGVGVASLISGTATYYILSAINPNIPYFGHVLPTAIVSALFAPLIIAAFMRFRMISRHGTTTDGVF